MKKEMTFSIAIIPVLFTVFILIYTVTFLNTPLFLTLIVGYLLTFIISYYYDRDVKKYIRASYQGIKSIGMIFVILMLIGILIAIWSSSGTLDALVYYGLLIIHPKYLIVISFIVSTLVSLILGTSVGTISTVGVAFMGLANSLGVNQAIVAGALVSGAFVGDRTSPLSSAAHINSLVTGTNYYKNIKELLKTLIPVIVITALIYYLIGVLNTEYNEGFHIVQKQAQERLLEYYGSFSLWLLIPPIAVFLLAFFKVPVKINLIVGILIGALIAYIFQERTISQLFQYAIFGYKQPNGLFGGAWNMFFQILFIVVAGAYYGLLESSGILGLILQRMTEGIFNRLILVRKTMIISILSAMLSSTQIMGILIPGKVMLKFYNDFDIDLKMLNRFISDSGLIVAGLIPWNLNAILLGIALHLPVVQYIPYAFLLMILPIFSYLHYAWEFGKKEKSTGRNLAKNSEL